MKIAGYNGFCWPISTPFMEPEISKFSSQLSTYRCPLSRSAGQLCPSYFFTVAGDEGQKFHSNPHARTRLSADSNVPWEILAIKTGPIEKFHQSIHQIAGAMGIQVIITLNKLRPFVAQIQRMTSHRAVRQRILGPFFEPP
jgi:hypothetical protein